MKWKPCRRACTCLALTIVNAVLVFGTVLCFIRVSSAQDWEIEAQKRVDAIVQKNGPGTNQALKNRLLEMMEQDQTIRLKLAKAPRERQSEFENDMAAVDKRLTAGLKEIVQQNGWPTIRLVGKDASQAAATILIHTADHSFQRAWLAKLQRLVEQDEILGDAIALISDKILLSEGKRQRFGTQFRESGDHLVWEPVEDPEHLEQRRAQYLLPPMSEYRRIVEKAYNKKIQP